MTNLFPIIQHARRCRGAGPPARKAAIGAAFLMFCTAWNVSALPVPIWGLVSMSGTSTMNKKTVGAANQFTSFEDVVVVAPSGLSGDFVGTTGSAVGMTPFMWSPANASLPISPLWSYVSGGKTYSFQLTSLQVDFVSATGLFLSGAGTASITGPGADRIDTPGIWNLSAQGLGSFSSTFSSTTLVGTEPVADGGTNLMLLGVTCIGFGLLSRNRVMFLSDL